jgi:hypothetical protein
MAKLILSLDDVVLEEIPLAKERTTIGRKPQNDIQIDNLAVSGEHAVIVTILNDCFLEDLGSTNGTLVNGVLAKKHLLQNNDVIELGKYKLKFVGMASSPAPTPADYEKTMIWRPGGVKAPAAPGGAPSAPGAPATRPAPPPPPPARPAAPPQLPAAAARPAPPQPPPAAARPAQPPPPAARTRPAPDTPLPSSQASQPSAASRATHGIPGQTESTGRFWKIALVLVGIVIAAIVYFRMRG